MLAEVPTCSVFLATCNKVPGATKQKMAFSRFRAVPRRTPPSCRLFPGLCSPRHTRGGEGLSMIGKRSAPSEALESPGSLLAGCVVNGIWLGINRSAVPAPSEPADVSFILLFIEMYRDVRNASSAKRGTDKSAEWDQTSPLQ